MQNLKRLSTLVLLLILSSCSSLNKVNPLSLLTNNSWALSSLKGKGIALDQAAGAVPSLNFLEDGKLAGFTGCNNFSGNFSLEGSAVTLDPGALTKKACPGSDEQDFLSALGNVNQLKVAKDKLTLFDGATELMSFIPKKN